MGNLIYCWPLLIIPIVVLFVSFTERTSRRLNPVKRPALWSPAKLALVEHETGVHPLRRACAEDGCNQCRMFCDATGPLSVGDGRTFHPARRDPGPIEVSGQAALEDATYTPFRESAFMSPQTVDAIFERGY